MQSFLGFGRSQLPEGMAGEDFAAGGAGGSVSGLVRRMNGLPDGAAAVEAARSVVEKTRGALKA